jgi:hypothetical protein
MTATQDYTYRCMHIKVLLDLIRRGNHFASHCLYLQHGVSRRICFLSAAFRDEELFASHQFATSEEEANRYRGQQTCPSPNPLLTSYPAVQAS